MVSTYSPISGKIELTRTFSGNFGDELGILIGCPSNVMLSAQLQSKKSTSAANSEHNVIVFNAAHLLNSSNRKNALTESAGMVEDAREIKVSTLFVVISIDLSCLCHSLPLFSHPLPLSNIQTHKVHTRTTLLSFCSHSHFFFSSHLSSGSRARAGRLRAHHLRGRHRQHNNAFCS